MQIRKFYYLLLVIFTLAFNANALVLSPQPRCISVLQPSGNVTITWSTPADPGLEFTNYYIYRAAVVGGPYVLVGTVASYLQTSFTDNTVNANAASFFYYIQTEYNAGGLNVSPPIDTIRSIKLNAGNPGNGTAQLTWNAIATPLIVTSATTYTVYREFPATVWTVIGTTAALNFKDTIFVCNRTLNYRVEISDNTGCTSVSSVSGGLFQNLIVPAIPVIDTLSVNNSNNAMLNWNVNSAADTRGYVIYRFNGGWVAIDTVFGINNTSYTYSGSTAGVAGEQYCVAALDSCGNISPLGVARTTIFLTASPNICERTATLNWSAYPTLGSGLSGYNIYHSITSAAGPYNLIGTVPAGTLTFTSNTLAPLITNYFKVEAFDVSGNKTVSSNRRSLITPLPIPPLYTIVRRASVMAENRIDVLCEVDLAASTLGYKLMRSSTSNPYNFSTVGYIPGTSSSPILFNDFGATTSTGSYYYKLVTIDSCNNNGQESAIHKTIFLKAQANADNTNTLSWSPYEGWPSGVAYYHVYRRMENGIINGIVTTTTDTNFIDDITTEDKGDGKFVYQVEAIENGGYSGNSLSNEALALQNEEIYIPNAFAPEGRNSVFKPSNLYFSFSNYSFEIYNRWGQQVYQTINVNDGWDGKSSQSGIYEYVIHYRNSRDENKMVRGSVMLVR